MSASHTPAPWHIDPNWGPSTEHPEWAAIKIGADTVSGHIGAANARLIAAAPDLLAACKKALKDHQASSTQYQTPALVKLLQDAIAKAEGQS